MTPRTPRLLTLRAASWAALRVAALLVVAPLGTGCLAPSQSYVSGTRGETQWSLDDLRAASREALLAYGCFSGDNFNGQPGTGEVVSDTRHIWRVPAEKKVWWFWTDGYFVDIFEAEREGKTTLVYAIFPPEQEIKNRIELHLKGLADAGIAKPAVATALRPATLPPPLASAPSAPGAPTTQPAEARAPPGTIAAQPPRERLSSGPAPSIAAAPSSAPSRWKSIRWEAGPKTWALIVGIRRYRLKSLIPPIDTAENDALELQRLLIEGGVPESQITLLLNEDATGNVIRQNVLRLRDFVRNPGERAIVYFSGHGAPIAERGQIVGGALVPYDGSPDHVAITCYSLEDLKKDIAPSERPFLVLLEACFSGASPIRPQEAALDIYDAEVEARTLTPSNPNHIILSATSGMSPANFDRDKRRHGLFTYFLLDGLRGEGDRNYDDSVQLEELFEYIKLRLENETRAMSRSSGVQSPQLLHVSKDNGLDGFFLTHEEL